MLDPTNPERYVRDIPLTLAIAAHNGTSYVPERRGEQEIAGYAATLAADYANLSKYATTDDKRATLEAEFTRYRTGYRRRFLVYLGARSRCLSSMITGPSNFPTARNGKRNRSADNKNEDMQEFRERALAAIRKTITPELQPIRSGDSDAIERLQAKIAKLTRLQDRMKAANAAIRKHAKAGADAQVRALVDLDFPEGMARELLEKDFAGRIGFASYQVTGNGQEIRRLEARLELLTKTHAEPVTTIKGELATYEDDPPENRVRVFFSGKPAKEVIERLKSGGFRWTPSKGCWQAYRSWKTDALARKFAGVPPESHLVCNACGTSAGRVTAAELGGQSWCHHCGAEIRVPQVAASEVTAA